MKPVGLALGAVGLLGLLLSSKRAEAVVDSPFRFGPAKPAAPPVPPPQVPVVNPIPPITIAPNGRHLSTEEKAILSPFIARVDLDNAIIWWNAPESSFASSDPNTRVEALTTERGIYMRGQNHAVTSIYDFVTLGHELVHVGQFRRGELPGPDTPEIELPAYQTGLAIEKHLEGIA